MRTGSRGRLAALVGVIAIVSFACGSEDPTGPTDSPAKNPSADPSVTIIAPEDSVTDPTVPSTPPNPDDPDAVPDSSQTSPSAPASGSLTPGLQRMVDIAVTDLVERRGLSDTAEIDVVSAEEVTWRDRALGCPRKDMQYAQVLTDGTRIVLATGGFSYHYHAGHGQDPFYCPKPEPPVGE